MKTNSIKTRTICKALLIMNSAFCIFFTSANAQTINFENNDYKQLGVYDTWEESPFRQGLLTGNCQVIDNFLNQDDPISGASPNQSAKMLAVQRSRYGSNTFGARIDLQNTFELTTSYKYVHVMINKPTTGRVMLVGLGKRPERTGQSPETEQFWVLASNRVQANTWTDAVFAIKGNGGIDIHSLVVVPDCESPHNLTEDYACYIDEIVVNDKATPRFIVSGEYGLNFDSEQAYTRTDRYLSAVNFDVASLPNQRLEVNTKQMYNNMTGFCFKAKAGETVTPTFNYSTNWMNGTVYVDWDNNGKFEFDIESNGKPAAGSNIMAYSFYSGKNSAGQTVANGNVMNPPSFKIPANTPAGLYRMRYKVDWNCIDPAGNMAEGNLITANGGAVVDVMLNVHGDYCQVNDANRNGEVLAADGSMLVSYKAPFGKPFTIKMNPERGFGHMGIRVRHGYNLAGDSLIHDNPQYRDTIFSRLLFENDEFTIPAECMDGDVEIEGLFVEKSSMPKIITYQIVDKDDNIIKTKKIEVAHGAAYPAHGLTSQCSEEYYTLQAIPEGTVTDNETVKLLYTSNFPFEVTTSLESAKWYNLTLTASQLGLTYTTLPPMQLATAYTAPKKGIKTLWCFMGNAFDGFRIMNGSTGTDQILASSTNTSANTGGNTYPIMVGAPENKSENYNTTWFVKKSNNLAGKNGFYLGQTGYPNNLMNSRNSNLAYWTGGADAGSTFTVFYVGTEEELNTISQTRYKIYSDSYKLVFEDNFDDESIDASKWVTSPKASAAWNRYISSDPRVAFTENGNLVCRAISDGGSGMLTGAKQTKGKFSFTNGYVEVRAKTRLHNGNFPAIWLMPDDQKAGWPNCGEIDIWETINNENKAYQTVHSNWTYNLGHTTGPSSGTNENCLMDEEWHTYGLMKNGTSLTWYIDGIKVFTYKKSDLSQEALNNTGWPFDKKFYIILNQSVGNGSWAANPDTSFEYETRFDYCRVYQTEAQASADGNVFTAIETTTLPSPLQNDTYDLGGRKMKATTENTQNMLPKGIYIIGGKKRVK